MTEPDLGIVICKFGPVAITSAVCRQKQEIQRKVNFEISIKQHTVKKPQSIVSVDQCVLDFTALYLLRSQERP